MYCDGSHGISVGSLGQYYGVSDIVSDIYIKNITMLNAEHGARIKVFPGHNDTSSVSGGGTGYVRNSECQLGRMFVFDEILMHVAMDNSHLGRL
jgi:hypothetical protein